MSSTPESRPLVEAWGLLPDTGPMLAVYRSEVTATEQGQGLGNVTVAPLIAADRLTEPDLGLSLLRHIMNAGEAVSVPNVLAALRAHLESPDA